MLRSSNAIIRPGLALELPVGVAAAAITALTVATVVGLLGWMQWYFRHRLRPA